MLTAAIRVCAWHEARQQTLSTTTTHGICEICLGKHLNDMNRKTAQWVGIMKDDNWQHKPDGTWMGRLENVTSSGVPLVVAYDAERRSYFLTRDGVEVTSGDLDECLTAGSAYLV